MKYGKYWPGLPMWIGAPWFSIFNSDVASTAASNLLSGIGLIVTTKLQQKVEIA